MKYSLLLFVIILASCQKSEETFIKAKHIPSKVDSLMTAQEVQDYIHAVDTFYNLHIVAALGDVTIRRPELDSVYKMYVRQYGIDKAFYKADFDNNGYTDLMAFIGFKSDPTDKTINSMDPIVVMNFRNDSVAVKTFSNLPVHVIVPELIHRKGQPMIAVHKRRVLRTEARTFEKDTFTKELVYKFDNFVEHNPAPENHKIERVQFAITPCTGECPVFEMILNQRDESYFFADYFNFSKYVGDPYNDKNDIYKKEGTFKTTIKPADHEKLAALLNYIDFTKLKDSYSGAWSCDQTVYLIITYDSGKQKKIYDYGRDGTFGLRAVYDLIHELRFNQDWQKAAEPKGIRIDQRSFKP